MTMNFWFGGRIFEEFFRVLLREKTMIFVLSNGRESGEGIEERNSQQNEGLKWGSCACAHAHTLQFCTFCFHNLHKNESKRQ